MDKKSDRVDTTRMDKTAGKTKNKMERQPYPPPGSFMANNSQKPASVETVQGGVPPYRVKETLVVNCKISVNNTFNSFFHFLLRKKIFLRYGKKPCFN